MPVELGYFTMKVKDVARGTAFYGALFGWEFAENGHVANTKTHLGLGAGGPVDVSFAYFQVDDIEHAAEHVVALGGSVRERNSYPSGLNAVCSDDQGTIFSLWQPAPGFE